MEEEFVILFKGKNSIELSYDIKNKESDLCIKIGKHGDSIFLNKKQALDLINFIQEKYLPNGEYISHHSKAGREYLKGLDELYNNKIKSRK